MNYDNSIKGSATDFVKLAFSQGLSKQDAFNLISEVFDEYAEEHGGRIKDSREYHFLIQTGIKAYDIHSRVDVFSIEEKLTQILYVIHRRTYTDYTELVKQIGSVTGLDINYVFSVMFGQYTKLYKLFQYLFHIYFAKKESISQYDMYNKWNSMKVTEKLAAFEELESDLYRLSQKN